MRLLVSAAALWASTATSVAETQPGGGSGRDVYNYYCYFCHGYSGDAETLAAAFLSPPPRDFTALEPDDLDRDAMLQAVTAGRPGTAMAPFASVLSEAEIASVVDFVRSEFMTAKAPNLAYHDPANGWTRDVRQSPAFPFAAGELSLDLPDEALDAEQREGKRLFLSACASCHDRGRTGQAELTWEPRAVSFPRGGFRYTVPPSTDPPSDAVTGATPYSQHDVIPELSCLSPIERKGEQLYQDNCAFCHAADGTGRNWIGTFLEPHPRDLTDPAFMGAMTASRLRHTIAEGLPGTSMPAWKAVLTQEDVDALVAYIARAFHPLKER